MSSNETLRAFGTSVKKFLGKRLAAKITKSYPNILIQVTFKHQVATARISHGIKSKVIKNGAVRKIDAFDNRSNFFFCCISSALKAIRKTSALFVSTSSN